MLWRHADWRSELVHVRRSRRLVVSSWANVGNYDYGFFWYFYLDGTIEAEVKLTGVPVGCRSPTWRTPDARCPRRRWPVGTASPAPVLFPARPRHRRCRELHRGGRARHGPASARTIREEPPSTLRRPAANRARGASRRLSCRGSLLEGERRDGAQSDRRTDGVRTGPWRPAGTCSPAPAARSRNGRSSPRHHLWVTQHADGELHAAGDYPNQHPGGDGLPAFTAGNRSLENTDVVLWFTCGSNHVARPEDWPVMPVEHAGFHLRPVGFFDRNPALDVPPQDRINPNGHCH